MIDKQKDAINAIDDIRKLQAENAELQAHLKSVVAALKNLLSSRGREPYEVVGTNDHGDSLNREGMAVYEAEQALTPDLKRLREESEKKDRVLLARWAELTRLKDVVSDIDFDIIEDVLTYNGEAHTAQGEKG